MAKVQNVSSPLINEPVSKLQVNPSPGTVLRLRKRIYIDLLLLFVTMVWGSTFLVTKYMLDVVGLFTYLGYNFGIGVLTLVLIFHKRLLRITRTQLLQGLVLGLFLFLGYSLQTIGLQYTTSSKAGFLTGLYIPLVPIFAVFLFREKLKSGAIPGFGLSLVGLALLSVNKDFNLVFGLGEMLILGCAIALALHIVFLGRFAPHADTMNLTIVQMATTSLLSFIAAVLTRQSLTLPETSIAWSVVLFMGILDLALCIAIINWSQRFVSSSHAALIYACEPVWAGLFGTLIGQTLTPFAWIGGGCICLGMVLGELSLPPLRSCLKRTKGFEDFYHGVVRSHRIMSHPELDTVGEPSKSAR